MRPSGDGTPEPAPGRYEGRVRRAHGGVYEVETEGGLVIEAVLRGRLKTEQRTGGGVVAGDQVTIERHEDGNATIEAVEPRRSQLARTAPGRSPRAKVIVANVDQVVPVFAVAQPEPHLRMLDRFLVLAEANDLDAVVVANKTDLTAAGPVRDRFRPYQDAGYPVLFTSAVTGGGLDALRDRLCERTSVLTGPSGVGKSTLLNALQPGLSLPVGAISEAVGKGRHTTVTAELIPLDCGGYVADTPGLRELGLWNVPHEELDLCFPELHRHVDGCRFGRSCTHIHEPACAVRAAVDAGEIDSTRYESYVALMEGDG